MQLGPYKRIVGAYFPDTYPPPPVYPQRWVTGYYAVVSSGQIVNKPYTPARYVWQVPDGISLYQYRRPWYDPTGPERWVQVSSYSSDYAKVYGGNGWIGDDMTQTSPNIAQIIIGIGTTNEDFLAGVRITYGYETEPGSVYGKTWSGNTLTLNAQKVGYNYDTGQSFREFYGTETCDFSLFYKNFNGRKYVPAGFEFLGISVDPFDNTRELPSMTWVDAGPFVS